jgi:hypothetical protein
LNASSYHKSASEGAAQVGVKFDVFNRLCGDDDKIRTLERRTERAREVIAAALNVPNTPEMNETKLVPLMLAAARRLRRRGLGHRAAAVVCKEDRYSSTGGTTNAVWPHC